jgi:hypothetical protein
MPTKTLLSTAILLAAAANAQASISVTGAGFTYSESFDSLTTSSFMSFGGSGSGDRALGSLASGGTYFGSPTSGAVAGYIAVAFVNNTGVNIDGFTVRFDGEQWRNGGNTATQSLQMSYGIGAGFGTVGAWTTTGWDVPSLVNTGTAAAVDGNTTGLSANLGGTVSTLTWAPGDTLWLRWADRNDTGNDHGLALDNFSISVSAIPEPGSLAMLLAGLGAVGFIARRRRA